MLSVASLGWLPGLELPRRTPVMLAKLLRCLAALVEDEDILERSLTGASEHDGLE